MPDGKWSPHCFCVILYWFCVSGRELYRGCCEPRTLKKFPSHYRDQWGPFSCVGMNYSGGARGVRWRRVSNTFLELFMWGGQWPATEWGLSLWAELLSYCNRINTEPPLLECRELSGRAGWSWHWVRGRARVTCSNSGHSRTPHPLTPQLWQTHCHGKLTTGSVAITGMPWHMPPAQQSHSSLRTCQYRPCLPARVTCPGQAEVVSR